MGQTLRVRIGRRWFTVEVEDLDSRPIRALVDGVPVEVEVEAVAPSEAQAQGSPAPTVPAGAARAPAGGEASPGAPQAARTVAFRAPMPGVIVSVSVKEGDVLGPGDEVCVLEAMKMQQRLRAEEGGRVVRVLVSAGQQVTEGTPIVELEPEG